MFARYFQRISQNNCVVGSLMVWHELVVYHANFSTWVGLKCEILVVVLLVLISVEVNAVKIEKTMRKFVASKGS